MKYKLLYLFPFLKPLAGYFNSKRAEESPVVIPHGTFTGQFRLLQFSKKTGVFDTVSANIQLSMEQTGYSVTGDTSTVQAGSYGPYAINTINSTIDFQDKTYPHTGIPTKTHLNGVYQYYYDGTVFQLVANSVLDKLSLQYDLKKQAIS